MNHSFTPADLFQYGFFLAVDVGMVGLVVLALRFAFYAVVAPTPESNQSAEAED